MKLWNVSYLFEEDGDVGESFKTAGVAAPPAAAARADGGDDDMMDDDDDDDDDSSDDDTAPFGGAGAPSRSSFFSDL